MDSPNQFFILNNFEPIKQPSVKRFLPVSLTTDPRLLNRLFVV